MKIIAAADGSSLGNPGPAGWAWVTTDGAWRAGGWPKGTNNQGELMAVLDLLRETESLGAQLHVLCDSQYVINAVTKWMTGWKRRGWKKADGKPVQNRDLLEQIDAALEGRQVEFEWVRGHAGHDLNEQADTYARAVATAYQRGEAPETGPGLGGDTGHPSDPQQSDASEADADESAEAQPVASGEAQLFDLAALGEETEGFERAISDELRALEISATGREHPQFEQAGQLTGAPPTSIRIMRLAADVALVRSYVGDAERTSIWQRTPGRHDSGDWMLRLRHEG